MTERDDILYGWTSIDSMGRTRVSGPAIDRLNAKLVATTAGCKEYVGYRNPKGYGQIGLRGSLIFTHRMAWIASFGEIPDGKIVCHTCDNPPCCNTSHLFLGSPRDNTRDMMAKKRGVFVINEANGRCKLSADEVRAIRLARTAGVPTRELARLYGVTRKHIGSICSGRRRSAVD